VITYTLSILDTINLPLSYGPENPTIIILTFKLRLIKIIKQFATLQRKAAQQPGVPDIERKHKKTDATILFNLF
jgi:hypothetical protein